MARKTSLHKFGIVVIRFSAYFPFVGGWSVKVEPKGVEVHTLLEYTVTELGTGLVDFIFQCRISHRWGESLAWNTGKFLIEDSEKLKKLKTINVIQHLLPFRHEQTTHLWLLWLRKAQVCANFGSKSSWSSRLYKCNSRGHFKVTEATNLPWNKCRESTHKHKEIT